MYFQYNIKEYLNKERMKIIMKKFLNQSECHLKGYLTGMKTEASKDMAIAKTLNEIVEENDISLLTESFIANQLLVKIPSVYFTLKIERSLNIQMYSKSLSSALEHLKNLGEIVGKCFPTFYKLPLTGRTVCKNFVFLIKTTDGYTFVELSKGKQKYGKSVGTKNSLVNFEHYMYYLAAKEYMNANNLSGDISIMNVALTPDTDAKNPEIKIWKADKCIRSFNFSEIFQFRPEIEDEYKQQLMDNDIVITNKNATPSPGCDGCTFCMYKNICDYIVQSNSTPLVPVQKENKGGKFNGLQLTDAQRELVEMDKGIARVLASAGSGKTTTLAGVRTSYLISEKGYKPKDFLFLTFSERGVREIKEKISEWKKYFGLKVKDSQFEVYTFNGFGSKILSENYERLGYDENPKIILKSEKIDLIVHVLDEYHQIRGLDYDKPLLNLFAGKGAVPFVEECFDWLTKHNAEIRAGENPVDILMKFYMNSKLSLKIKFDEKDEAVKKALTEDAVKKALTDICEVFKEYDKLKKEKNYIEFDDQINLALNILERPNSAAKYSTKHIVVDEYQDTDKTQMRILQLLVDTPSFESFIACGDDSQAIFSWRGATVDNIINFSRYFDAYGDVRDIHLTSNFRCNSVITDLTNKINDRNRQKVDKKVVAYNAGKLSDIVIEESKSEEEAVLESINTLLGQGYKYQDIAVITRTNGELLNIASFLDSKAIPNNLIVTQSLIDIPEVRGMISFGKYIQNPENKLYLMEFYQIISGTPITDVPFEVYEENEEFFSQQLLELNEEELLDYFSVVVEQLKESNNGTRTFAKIYEEQEFESIYELAGWLSDFVDYNETLGVEKDLTLYEAVTLMTSHSSKGSEFKAVIVLLDKFDYHTSNLDEERKSLFVAMTRAKEKLHIKVSNQKKCRMFYNEIQECYTQI